MNVMIEGESPLDHKFFFGLSYSPEKVENFIKGLGLDTTDPVSKAELFGNFQEAVQFIRRYFLKEDNPNGLDLKIPHSLFAITDARELLMMITKGSQYSAYEQMWAEVILKVMHTILHVDKDLRLNYFSVIQTQIFDRYYKYIHRDQYNQLYLGTEKSERIPLEDFEAKSKKTRDSVIIKLLCKMENVAEELFDQIGIRFITKGRFDVMRVLKFLLEKNIIIPHNIKPSRSFNSLVDMNKFKKRHLRVLKMSMRNNLSEDRFLQALDREMMECLPNRKNNYKNMHSSSEYRSIQLTCRQLIKYQNPFLQEFYNMRGMAKKMAEEDKLAKKILSLDSSLIAKNIQFFYPYEIQILDIEGHRENTLGEASHKEYKKAQIKSVIKRIFKFIIEYKKINLD